MVLKSPSNIKAAAEATSVGLYKTAAGCQWAYIGEITDEWPVKPERSKKPERVPKSPRSAPLEDSGQPILPPVFTEVVWRPIPYFEGYEVNTLSQVRCNGTVYGTLEERYCGKVSLVMLYGHRYKCVELMCLAFIGPAPYGYVMRKRQGTSEKLANVFYEQRNPCKSEAKEPE